MSEGKLHVDEIQEQLLKLRLVSFEDDILLPSKYEIQMFGQFMMVYAYIYLFLVIGLKIAVCALSV